MWEAPDKPAARKYYNLLDQQASDNVRRLMDGDHLKKVAAERTQAAAGEDPFHWVNPLDR